MGVEVLSYQNFDINDLFRACVRAEMKAGPRNESGAMATVATSVGVSALTVRLRCRDHTIGVPRKKHIRERCWAFLDSIAERERAWAERLAEVVERQRQDLQLILPLEGTNDAASNSRSIPGTVARAEGSVAAARRAAGDYARERAKLK